MTNFNDDFYKKCNEQRIELLRDIYGEKFFENKTVLDLGGGVGYISNQLMKWGADCTVYEGRDINIELGRKLHPNVKFIKVDLQNFIPIKKFDIVLNFGVFYHLINPEVYLSQTAYLFNDFMLLDGNISTSGERFIEDNTIGIDQSLHGRVKLIDDEIINKTLENYNLESLNKKMNKIADKTGSPYDYENGEDFLKTNEMKRTFWMIKNN